MKKKFLALPLAIIMFMFTFTAPMFLYAKPAGNHHKVVTTTTGTDASTTGTSTSGSSTDTSITSTTSSTPAPAETSTSTNATTDTGTTSSTPAPTETSTSASTTNDTGTTTSTPAPTETSTSATANTQTLESLVMNRDFSNGLAYWVNDTAAISVESKMLAITARGKTGGGGCTITTTPGHLYYYAVTLKGVTTNNNYIMIEGQGGTCKFTIGSGTQRLTNVFKATSTTHHLMALDYRSSGWTKFYLDPSDLVVVDLTEKFGAGSEPSLSWCDTNITTTGSTTETNNTRTSVTTESSLTTNTGTASGTSTTVTATSVTTTAYGTTSPTVTNTPTETSTTVITQPEVNLVLNKDFSNGLAYWVSDTAAISVESKMLAITARGITGGGGCTITTTPGHLYYYAVTLKAATANKNFIMIEGKGDTPQFTVGSGTQRLTNVFKATATTHHLMALDYRSSGWTKFYLDPSDLVVVDLTEKFGAGYEPSPSWCDTNINTTGLINAQASGSSASINEYITYPVAGNFPENVYDVTSYGAKGDGLTDDTGAINTAIAKANAAGGGTVYIPNGTYLINVDDGVGIELASNIRFRLADNAVLQAKATNAATYGIIRIVSRNNIEIYGGRIIGDLDTHLGTTGEWGSGIELYNSSNIHIHDVKISKTWGDCIYLGDSSQTTYNQNVLIENFTLDYPGRNGISVISAKNLVIQNGTITNAVHTAPNGIDIEPNYITEWSYNILIKNVTVDNVRGYGFSYGGPDTLKDTKNPVHITLDHFVATNCGNGAYRSVYLNNFEAYAPIIFNFEFIN